MTETAPESEAMVTLHEQMVQLVEQLQMPLLEVSLVISKYTRMLSERLQQIAAENHERIPALLSEAWPLTEDALSGDGKDLIDIEILMRTIDEQRMDILDTLVRSVINMEQIPLADALIVLRGWEQAVRMQLGQSAGPGQLFSPFDMPEDGMEELP